MNKGDKTYEVVRHIRGSWGAINPITKIIPNKKKNPNPKHKGKERDYSDN